MSSNFKSVREPQPAWRCNAAAALLALPLLLAAPVFSQTLATGRASRNVVPRQVDEYRLVTLRGNVHPAATAANDRGLVADALPLNHMMLQLKRSPAQERAFAQLIDQLHDRASPNFHHWLTAEQIGAQFGPSDQDIAAISSWLESHGFAVNVVYPDRTTIDFSGSAGAVNRAFHTEIHNLVVNGQRHIANMTDPQIPSALSGVVAGVVALHDFKPHPMYRPRSDYTFTRHGHTDEAVVPADLATIYNFSPVYTSGITGAGQTIALIEDTDLYSTSDWSTFRSTFGLAGYSTGSLSTVHPTPALGPNNCLDPGFVEGPDSEAALDVEWASAAAPGATIELVSCADTNVNFGGFIALHNLISHSNPPALVSISYGLCEQENGTTANENFYSVYQSAAAEGVSVFVSSGDEGAASCDANAQDAQQGISVSGFASTPYNVAVGGTDFSDTSAGTVSTYWSSTNSATYGSALSYIPEIPWNDSCASELVYAAFGFSAAYGTNGFCNYANNRTTFPASGLGGFINTTAGSGGPSNHASCTGFNCQGWPKPSWQSGVTGIVADSVRDLPDVSLFAANGTWGHYLVFCYSDKAGGGHPCTGAPSTWAGGGGTSFSAPIWAGIQALVNQKTGEKWGNPNTTYYHLAATSSNVCNSSSPSGTGCIFYDVTEGDIDLPCTALPSGSSSVAKNCYGNPTVSTVDVVRERNLVVFGVLSTSNTSFAPAYRATAGWDFATGLGTVNVANLVNNW